MTPENWVQAKRIFAEALDLDPGEREAFLLRACGDRPDLLAEVREMLAESGGDSERLDLPSVANGERPKAVKRFSPQHVLADRYRILRFIAAGGMGEVYEADDLVLGEPVALKAVRPEIARDQRILSIFKREVQLARRVTNPHVCRVYDLTQTGEDALLSMEMLRGETLSERLRKRGPMSCREALQILEQVAAGLQAAHEQGIIHRDLKPGNIMLVSDPGSSGFRAVVTDFGLAYSVAGGATLIPGGTPGYAAPEQALGAPPSSATDIYSLGMVIEELVGGTGSGEGARWQRVSMRCRETEPAKRYARVVDVVTDLRRALGSRPRKLAVISAIAIVVLALGITIPLRWLPSSKQPVFLLVTALDNQSGEPVLDGAIPYLLERDIGDSRQINVAPAIRVADTLRLMKRDPQPRVDSAIAREVCLRDGGIRLIVNSHAQKIGATYLIAADISEAATGKLLGGVSEESGRVEAVPAAIGRLALAIRRIAGEGAAERLASAVRLEHVTTPSLRACQLYSQAYSEVQPVNWPVAEKLTREALAEDPQFASAHLWLAWALNNQQESHAERDDHLAQAITYSRSASDRERQFILASEATIHKRDEEAIVLYRKLLVSYPDDYWARNNLVVASLRLGKEDSAERYRLSDLRPKDLSSAFGAYRAAALSNDAEAMRRFRGRVAEVLKTGVAGGPVSAAARWLSNYRFHELWLAGRLEELRDAIDGFGHDGTKDWTYHLSALTFYEALGRLRTLEAALKNLTTTQRLPEPVDVQYLLDRPGSLRELLQTARCCDTLSALMSIQENWTPSDYEDALRRMDILPETEMRRVMDARWATLHRDLDSAAQFFSKWPLPVPLINTLRGRLVIAMQLARAHELAGDPGAGLRTLAAADYNPAALYENTAITDAAFWHRLRYERARLLRKVGAARQAEEIETALRRDLRLADPDHPLLVRLNQSGRKPLEVY